MNEPNKCQAEIVGVYALREEKGDQQHRGATKDGKNSDNEYFIKRKLKLFIIHQALAN